MIYTRETLLEAMDIIEPQLSNYDWGTEFSRDDIIDIFAVLAAAYYVTREQDFTPDLRLAHKICKEAAREFNSDNEIVFGTMTIDWQEELAVA